MSHNNNTSEPKPSRQVIHAPENSKNRWETEVGKEFTKKITAFLQDHIERNSKIIDFMDVLPPDKFSFTTNNQRDLVYVTLPVLKFDNCTLRNVNLSYAQLEKWEFNDVALNNCIFDESKMQGALFYDVRLNDNTTINNTNLRGAKLIKMTLDDRVMVKPIKFSSPWNPFLLLKIVLKLFCIDINWKFHTYFNTINLNELNTTANKELKSHIIWYEHVMLQIDNFKERSFRNKVSLVLAIWATHYWNSYRVLAFWAVLFNLFMAYQIINLPDGSFDFGAIEKNYGSAFYYCIVTFTTLGYGDVHPCTGIAQFYAGSTAVMGYITLGILIYLITRKVDRKF